MLDEHCDLLAKFDEYGFFDDCSELVIIDDYCTNSMSDAAKQFFRTNFRHPNLRHITFYFQPKRIKKDIYRQILDLGEKLNVNGYKLESFLLMTVDKFSDDLIQCLRNIYANQITTSANRTIDLIQSLQDSVQITYQLYSNHNIKPPLHGRYWITENRGFIVDASLNTFRKGKIFVQEMDKEN